MKFDRIDYRSLLKYGDIKKICEATGLTPYKVRTRLEKADEEMIEIIEIFYRHKLEAMKLQIYDYESR